MGSLHHTLSHGWNTFYILFWFFNHFMLEKTLFAINSIIPNQEIKKWLSAHVH